MYSGTLKWTDYVCTIEPKLHFRCPIRVSARKSMSLVRVSLSLEVQSAKIISTGEIAS